MVDVLVVNLAGEDQCTIAASLDWFFDELKMAVSSASLNGKLKCDEVKEELIAAKDRISNERNKKYPGLAAVALGMEL